MLTSVSKAIAHTKNWFNQPYPLYYVGKSLWVIVGVLVLMSFLFNFLFEPFHVYQPEHKMPFVFISLIHGLNTGFVLFLLSFLVKSKKTRNNWKIWKEVAFIFLFFLLVGIAQFLIRDIIYDNPNNWTRTYLLEEIRNTFMVGSLFLFIILPFNYNRLKSYYKEEPHLRNTGVISASTVSTIPVETPLANEQFYLDLNSFLFAKADGNYTEVYLINSSAEKLVKRMPLKMLEDKLSSYPYIFKIHRSYLVNTRSISRIQGNALGFRLEIQNGKYFLPVSRNRVPAFKQLMQDRT